MKRVVCPNCNNGMVIKDIDKKHYICPICGLRFLEPRERYVFIGRRFR